MYRAGTLACLNVTIKYQFFLSIPYTSRLPLSVHMPRNVYPESLHCCWNILFPRQSQSPLTTHQVQFPSLPVSLAPNSVSKSVYPFLVQLLSLLSLTYMMSSVLPSNKQRRQGHCRQDSWQVSEQGSLELNHRWAVCWGWGGWAAQTWLMHRVQLVQ